MTRSCSIAEWKTSNNHATGWLVYCMGTSHRSNLIPDVFEHHRGVGASPPYFVCHTLQHSILTQKDTQRQRRGGHGRTCSTRTALPLHHRPVLTSAPLLAVNPNWEASRARNPRLALELHHQWNSPSRQEGSHNGGFQVLARPSQLRLTVLRLV